MEAYPRAFWVWKTEPLQDDRVYGVRLWGKFVLVREPTASDTVPDRVIPGYGELVGMPAFHSQIQVALHPYCSWWHGSKIETPKGRFIKEKEVLGWVDGRIAVSAEACWAVVQVDTPLVELWKEMWKRVDELDAKHVQTLIKALSPPIHLALVLFKPSRVHGKPEFVELVFRNNLTSRLFSWTVLIRDVRMVSDHYRSSISSILADETRTLQEEGGAPAIPEDRMMEWDLQMFSGGVVGDVGDVGTPEMLGGCADMLDGALAAPMVVI